VPSTREVRIIEAITNKDLLQKASGNVSRNNLNILKSIIENVRKGVASD